MECHQELYSSLKQHKVQEALYITGSLIFSRNIEALEQTWIRAVATIGEYTNVCFPKWHETCREIVAILHTEEFHVKEAFQITTMICILYQNADQYIVFPKLTIPQLRTKVVDLFSDSIKLSESGKQKFINILPKPSNEKEFCLKIISGLIKLWTQKDYIKLREGLEYVCRKDYMIESIPSETEPNITSFLWDFMKVFQKDTADPLYIIYKTGFKKKDKSWRNSLLYGIHNYLHPHYGNLSWSDYENDLLHKTTSITEELWKYIVSVHQEDTKEIDEGDSYDKMSIFESYYPKATYDFNSPSEYPSSEREQVKSVSIKSKKKSKTTISSSKEKDLSYNKSY